MTRDHVAEADRVTAARTAEVRTEGRPGLTRSRAHRRPCLYTLVPSPPADPSVLQRPPVTVRCERELGVGDQIWVQQECWELVETRAPLDETPQRSAFLCATSPPPRARVLAGAHESWLYEPDLIDLARAVRQVHTDETRATRTVRAAIRGALRGDTAVEANLEGDALRLLAQAIRGLELSRDLSPALRELGRKLNLHFDALKRPLAEGSSVSHGRQLVNTSQRAEDSARRLLKSRSGDDREAEAVS
jgi:hypothetical protein